MLYVANLTRVASVQWSDFDATSYLNYLKLKTGNTIKNQQILHEQPTIKWLVTWLKGKYKDSIRSEVWSAEYTKLIMGVSFERNVGKTYLIQNYNLLTHSGQFSHFLPNEKTGKPKVFSVGKQWK